MATTPIVGSALSKIDKKKKKIKEHLVKSMELTTMTNEGQMTMNWNITYKKSYNINFF